MTVIVLTSATNPRIGIFYCDACGQPFGGYINDQSACEQVHCADCAEGLYTLDDTLRPRATSAVRTHVPVAA